MRAASFWTTLKEFGGSSAAEAPARIRHQPVDEVRANVASKPGLFHFRRFTAAAGITLKSFSTDRNFVLPINIWSLRHKSTLVASLIINLPCFRLHRFGRWPVLGYSGGNLEHV
jgi:hypothetical protein